MKIFGENPNEESTSGPDAIRSFVNKPRWQQAIVLFAGVFANFLLAWVLFSFGFMSGLPMPVSEESQNYNLSDVRLTIISVTAKSPAFLAGLKNGDKIVSLASGDHFTSDVEPETVKSFSNLGKEITIGYLRNNGGMENFVKITPKINPGGEPMIGIAMSMVGEAKLSFFAAIYEGMKLTLNTGKGMILGLYHLIGDAFKGQGSLESLAGPVGIVGMVGDVYQFGFTYLMAFAALISVNLAIINLLPFPALDGGRLLFLFIEKIKGSRLNPKFANTANMIGFGILIILMIIVTFHDVVKLF